MKLLILFALMTFAAFAQNPDSQSCEYYLSLEEEYQCGKWGYPLTSGYQMCQRYLTSQAYLPPKLKAWFPKVRFCLQEFLEHERGHIRDCSDLRNQAINSHVQCYKETGFCDLSRRDVLTLSKITGRNMLKRDFLHLTLKLSTLCY